MNLDRLLQGDTVTWLRGDDMPPFSTKQILTTIGIFLALVFFASTVTLIQTNSGPGPEFTCQPGETYTTAECP
jgi:hypothetical protein